MSGSEILLESGTNELEIIEFFISEGTASGEKQTHYFGVNVAKVLEVIENPGLVSGKSAVDPCFMGTIPLREKVLPVIDLSIWLRLKKEASRHEVILVTEFNNTLIGFLASGVTQIYRVSWQDVEPPGRFLTSVESGCVTGIVHFKEHSLLMLDLESFLAEYDSYQTNMNHEAIQNVENAYTALVVDDSRSMRDLIVRSLEESKFNIVTASNGEEAWNIMIHQRDNLHEGFRSAEEMIDIIVSDIEMPRMDGMTLTKKIKSDPVLRGVPVILFSSLITDSLRHKGQSVGADMQISKPEFSELAARSIQLINTARSTNTAS
ncbi:MAG: chemotaxis protein CheV [Desulfovibrio sp.]|nr:chemotaxis protein CheV [Desulfovibrio sp.]MBI4960659.1 chemotaxis protein CheV [Desulfovibrio sp.]